MTTVNACGVNLSELCISDKENHLPEEIGVISMSLKRLLALFRDGKIKVYEHNRGFGKASKNTIEATRNNLQVSCLGMFRISNEGVIADGNSRMLGINLRFMDGNITDSELDESVTILCFLHDNFLVHYQAAGRQAGHTSGNKLTNPQLGMGQLVQSVVTASGINPNILQTSHLASLSNTIWSLANIPVDDWDFANIFSARKHVKNLLDYLPSELSLTLSRNNKARLVQALRYFEDVSNAIRGSDAKSFLKSGPFFGLIISEHLSAFSRLLPAPVLARRMVSNGVKLAPYIPCLTLGAEQRIRRTANKVLSIICRP
jgi:hypothetical protein